MFSALKKWKCLLAGDTPELNALRREKKAATVERKRAQERSIEQTSEFTQEVIKAWSEAGVDMDIEREIERLGRFGGKTPAAR